MLIEEAAAPMVESASLDNGPLPLLAARATPPKAHMSASSVQALVQAHADFVWRSVRRLGVPESAADDATQQVFVVAAAKLAHIQAGRERAFLFATLSHVAAHVRRSLARKREQTSDSIDERADPSPGPDEIIETRRARALLDEALDTLSTDLRAVFVLSELEELTAPEVAEVMGLPVGTVASRLRRAREQFQKAATRLRARPPRRQGSDR